MYVYEAANLDSHDKFFYSRVTWDVRLSFKLFFVVVVFFFFFVYLVGWVGLVWIFSPQLLCADFGEAGEKNKTYKDMVQCVPEYCI